MSVPATDATTRSRAWSFADRAAGLALLGALLALGPAVLARAGDDAWLRAGLGTALLAAGLAALALVIAPRGAGVVRACAGVAGRHPLAAVFVAVGGAALALAVLAALTEWGLALVLLVGAGAPARVTLCDPARRRAAAARLLLGIATTSALLLAALGAAELWLRRHPERVGGGGGGNPALATLYEGLYRYNALGLRGPEVAPVPKDGTVRVLAVGDSFTFGQGVAEEHTWPARLERLLADRRDAAGPAVEVVNAGRAGLDTRGELQWLEEHGAALRPDLVIVQFFVNDVIVHRRIGAPPPSRVAAVLSAARRHVWTLFVLRERFDGLLAGLGEGRVAPPDWRAVFARGVRRGGPGWRDCAAALDELGAWATAADVPVLVVLYPHPGPPHPGTRVVHEAVAERARAAGLAVLDLEGGLRTVPLSEHFAHDYDHHPSPALHARAAELVADELARRGWLP